MIRIFSNSFLPQATVTKPNVLLEDGKKVIVVYVVAYRVVAKPKPVAIGLPVYILIRGQRLRYKVLYYHGYRREAGL